MKAFLSHSSNDRALVSRVANELGRQFCLYDAHAFDTGEELLAAIERCLDETSLFVLFGSQNSLSSTWVSIEINEAHQRKLRETIKRSLVYLIDSSTTPNDLPDWLRRAIIRRQNMPKLIARDIRHHIDELLRQKRHTYFIGRTSDVERLEQVLTPCDGTPPPRAFVISGLPGIGRRSLIRQTAPNLLSLTKYTEIRIAEGDSLNDICAKLEDTVGHFVDSSQFQKAFAAIQLMPGDEVLERLLSNLRTLVSAQEMPVLYDEGGLLDHEGYLNDNTRLLFERVSLDQEAYLAIVSYRRPQGVQGTMQGLPVVPLAPLGRPETGRLMQRLFADSDLPIQPGELAELTEFVAGYPPAAFFALQQAKDYGVALVIRHKHRLVQFRTSVFLRHIQGMSLDTLQVEILKTLAGFTPLPLDTLLSAVNSNLESVDRVLTKLIDMSLVIVDSAGHYRISDPVTDAATRAFGLPDKVTARRVAAGIRKHLEETAEDLHRLELSRVLFRASRLAGQPDMAGSAVRLASDMIRLTEDLYHLRAYDTAIECGKTAVDERPGSVTARSYLIRSLIQKERWIEARQQLEELIRFAPPREVHFLTGFLERKRGDIPKAVEEFEQSARLGKTGAALSRELSHSYFLLGDSGTAALHLKEAVEKHEDNRFVVDLWAQIASANGDEAEAHRALSRLELIDQPMYYLYRLSRVEWQLGNNDKAFDAAIKAYCASADPPFSVIAQAALCALATARLSEAEEYVNMLDRDFHGMRRDIRTGLRCRLLILKGKFEDALRLSDRIENKETQYYKAIRHDCIDNILAVGESADADRYVEELQVLEEQLGTQVRFDLPEIDNS